MAKHQEEPASTIIRFIGGATAVAEIIGKHPSRVYRWTASEDAREGSGGLIPAKYQRRLLDHAQANGLDLRPDDFFSPDRLRALLDKQEGVAA